MQQTQDLRVAGFLRLQPPCKIKEQLPMSERANQTVVRRHDVFQWASDFVEVLVR